MSEGEISSLSRLIPTLTGTESFVAWRRAINAYLLDKGSLRVLEGREKEPFRREIDSTVPGDALIVRPVGDYAGAEIPTDIQQAIDGTAVPAYTAAQRTRWDELGKEGEKSSIDYHPNRLGRDRLRSRDDVVCSGDVRSHLLRAQDRHL